MEKNLVELENLSGKISRVLYKLAAEQSHTHTPLKPSSITDALKTARYKFAKLELLQDDTSSEAPLDIVSECVSLLFWAASLNQVMQTKFLRRIEGMSKKNYPEKKPTVTRATTNFYSLVGSALEQLDRDNPNHSEIGMALAVAVVAAMRLYPKVLTHIPTWLSHAVYKQGCVSGFDCCLASVHAGSEETGRQFVSYVHEWDSEELLDGALSRFLIPQDRGEQ